MKKSHGLERAYGASSSEANNETLLVVLVVVEKRPIVLVRLMVGECFARTAFHDDARYQAQNQAYSYQASNAGVRVEEKVVKRTKIHDYLVTLTRPIVVAAERLHFSVRVYYAEPIRYGSALIFLYSLRAPEKGKHMRAIGGNRRRRRIVASITIVTVVAVVVAVVLGLTSFIDKKLNQSAEQQVVTFTEQAAMNVADRMHRTQNAIGSFTVQTTDPELIVPALENFVERNGFEYAAFAGMDGEGVRSDGSAFSIGDLPAPETALSEERVSYSSTFADEEGARARLAQTPLYIGDQQIGALYVQVPLSLFSMPRYLDMFDGRGYFMLFEGSTGEVLVPPADETKTPVSIGASLYDFLDKASRYDASSNLADSSVSAEVAMQFVQIRSWNDLSALRDVVAGGQSGLLSAMVDGKASYVCVAPVDSGYWYVCSVMPVENVRAEAAVVTTTFEVVFAIVFACLAVVALLVFGAYRRRLRERNVAMLTQLYEALSDSIDMAVNMYSPGDGSVTPIVAKADRIIGYRLDAFLKNERLALSIGLSPEGMALFARIRADEVKGFEQGEFSFHNKYTGKECWASYSVKRLTFDDKSQLLIVMRDVTADKEIQLSMKDAMDVAEAANAAKSEFLSRMSHEIRTPMNVIIGMLQIAQGNVDDREKVMMSLAKIGAASDHLLGLINDVLDISKIENGKMTLASEPFRLNGMLASVIAAMRTQCEQRNQEFTAAVPPCAEAVFVGDAVRLRQLLLNLLSNAVKYTPRGGHIRFETSVSKGAAMGYRQVTFTVSDDGIGMSEEFKERIFEPFSMEGRSHEQGTGLGMPIVKNIVTMIAGDIAVESTKGAGSTFVVTFNLRIALEAERVVFEEAEGIGAEDDEPALSGMVAAAVDLRARGLDGSRSRPVSAYAASAAGAPRALDRIELEGLRVLLAEDNDLNAEIACELLSEAGLVVDRAEDGAEALAKFDASPIGYFDVILMDVQMPNLNGYEATKSIRALGRDDANAVPIIAMSANAFAEDVSRSLSSGMDAHLSKPIDMRRVLATIVKYVRKRNGEG